MKLIVEGAYCSSSGCNVTDRITLTVTVNPGTVSSRIDVKQLYSPSAGNFGTSRTMAYHPIIFGKVGPTGSQIQSKNNWQYVLAGYSSRSGWKPLTIAVGVRVTSPAGAVVDGAKTADCYGSTENDHSCYYFPGQPKK